MRVASVLGSLTAIVALVAWRMGWWAIAVFLMIFDTLASVVLVPIGVLGLLFTAVFGFWAQVPHVYEQRWTLALTSFACIGVVALLRLAGDLVLRLRFEGDVRGHSLH